MLNKGLARDVRELQVYCPNMSEGCNWVGEIGNVETHLSSGVSDNSARFCQLEKVACSNEGCKEKIYRRDLAVHQSENCHYRIAECPYCESYQSTYDDLTSKHYSSCLAYPIDCPNGCGERNLPRNKLQEHLEKCPNQLVDCDFKPVGCTIRRSKATMSGHLDMNTNFHMRLLCRAVSENRAKLETVDELEKQVATLQEENKKVRDENSSLVNLNNQLKSDVTNVQKQVESLDQQLQMTKSQEEELQKRLDEQASSVEEAKQARIKLEEELVQLKGMINQRADLNKIKEEVELQKAAVTTLQVDVAHCKETVNSKDKEIKSLKQSVDEEIDKRAAVMMVEIKHSSTKLEKTIKEVKDELNAAVQANEQAQKGQIDAIDEDLKYVERWLTPRPAFAFTVSRFQERKSHKEAFVSPPFYHDLRGYKMCVRVDVYGMNNHVAVFCCIMRGEHDEHLDWPFLGSVKIRLQNHLGDHNHFEKDIRFDEKTDEKKSGRVKTGDKNYLHGHPQFIAHNKLAFDAEKNCQYLKGDALDFEVIGVELLPHNE